MRGLIFIFVFVPFFLSAQNKPGTALAHKKGKKTRLSWTENWKKMTGSTAQVATDRSEFSGRHDQMAFSDRRRVTFDDQYLYVSFVCMDYNTPDLINSLRRDFDYPLNDNVGVNIGPYNDGLNGFFFAVTPAGVQREGIISGGGAGTDAFNSFWDNKWYSIVVRYDDRWIAEFAIPWKSFRYKDGLNEWNILFDRSDKKRNLRSSWIRTPIQFRLACSPIPAS